MGSMNSQDVRLRAIMTDDLPQLFEFNFDPEANRLAATKPRSRDNFVSHWQRVLSNPDIVARAIVLGDQLAGSISCFGLDGQNFVGYWLGRVFWGQGVASKALALLLTEVTVRPLYAHVATHNRASMRVLEKCGFVVLSVKWSPEDDRLLACDEALLELA
ncbi:MAG: GNAT family N-acetyltransferase [Planctomycetaceae bacterium]|nr:GNAT family N-acetyltransferase [Planctomycetaceae bacterium]